MDKWEKQSPSLGSAHMSPDQNTQKVEPTILQAHPPFLHTIFTVPGHTAEKHQRYQRPQLWGYTFTRSS